MAHKLPGDEGLVSSTETLSPTPQGLPCAGAHRQHHSGCLYQPSGRSAFTPYVQVGAADPALGRDQTPFAESDFCSRAHKSGDRLPVETSAEAWGVVVESIWRIYGQAEVDLFTSEESTHCPLWYSLSHPAPLGLDALVQTWLRLHLYTFPWQLYSHKSWPECATTWSTSFWWVPAGRLKFGLQTLSPF
ncbi:hypothetical protein QTP86_006944 [Hemibagrus guttatus]|nr:hypothetical protein QTP86_006944 [Hemibagrus guttatus]